MHLVDLLALRSVPAAGISIGITRRCPLSCAHCSTSSDMQREECPDDWLEGFVNTFTKESHPRFMAMSGGEALLRPELVKNLALRARESGTKSSLLSGLFFARQDGIPKPIKSAIDAVDHLSVSMDEFHEREVPRSKVFTVLRQLLDEGKALSMHIAGRDQFDTYVDELVEQVKARFGNHIPMLVNTLSPFGRAKNLIPLKRNRAVTTPEPNPCTMAAWPVVGFDGVIAACGNDNLIGQVPSHLNMGHITTHTWSDVYNRCVQGPIPIALRTYGPEYLKSRFSTGQDDNACGGYCETCIELEGKPDLLGAVAEHMKRPSSRALNNSVIELQLELGPVEFAKRHSHPRFAELVLLGTRS